MQQAATIGSVDGRRSGSDSRIATGAPDQPTTAPEFTMYLRNMKTSTKRLLTLLCLIAPVACSTAPSEGRVAADFAAVYQHADDYSWAPEAPHVVGSQNAATPRRR